MNQPRRVSSDESDPGYPAFLVACDKNQMVRVYLDGKQIEHPITADEDKGIIVKWMTDKSGDVLNVTQVLHGDVTIELITLQ